ncbi:Uncharacterised protein [Mycobacteroides abscessus subsp. abscessus]|nr:Uncharacterised protein [Mycobacteroides abscessus subsp. abscessus]
MSDSVKRDPKACLTPDFTLMRGCLHALRRGADRDLVACGGPVAVYPWGRLYRADFEKYEPI